MLCLTIDKHFLFTLAHMEHGIKKLLFLEKRCFIRILDPELAFRLFERNNRLADHLAGAFVLLGHMQRGGSPTAKDRVYASIMGAKAVDLLVEGKTNRVVGYKHGEYVDFDIDEALNMEKGIPQYQYDIAKELAL